MKKKLLLLFFIPFFSFGQFHLGQLKYDYKVLSEIPVSSQNIKDFQFSNDEKFLFIACENNNGQLFIITYDLENSKYNILNTTFTNFKDFRVSPSKERLLLRDIYGYVTLVPDIKNISKTFRLENGSGVRNLALRHNFLWHDNNTFEMCFNNSGYNSTFDINKWIITKDPLLESDDKLHQLHYNQNYNQNYFLKFENICGKAIVTSSDYDANGSDLTVYDRNSTNSKYLDKALCNSPQSISRYGKYVAYIIDNSLKLLKVTIDESITEKIYCVNIPNFESYNNEIIQTLKDLLSNNQNVTGAILKSRINPVTGNVIVPAFGEILSEQYVCYITFTKIQGDVLFFKIDQKLIENYNVSENDFVLGATARESSYTAKNGDINVNSWSSTFKFISKVGTTCIQKIAGTKNDINNSSNSSNTNSDVKSELGYVEINGIKNNLNEIKTVEVNSPFTMSAGEKVKFFMPFKYELRVGNLESNSNHNFEVKVYLKDLPESWFIMKDNKFVRGGKGEILTDRYYIVEALTNVENLQISLKKKE